MDFGLTKEQQAIKNAVREFLMKEAKNVAREAEETKEGYSLEVWRKMSELGWMGVSFPEEYGGNGGDILDMILILEEMGRFLVPGPFIPSVICSGHAVLNYGTEAQKRQLLPKLANGSHLIAPAFIEPTSHMVGSVEIKQVKIGKQDYELSGTRLFVPYGHLADWFIYGTRIDKGKTLFLVNAKNPRINCDLLETIASDRQCEIVLDKVKVSMSDILGEIGSGEEIISKISEWGAIFECGYILGLLEEVLRISVEYAKKREQFGRPIGSFQAIQHQFSDMATDIDQVKFLTYQAAWKLCVQLPAKREISMAKARASDASRRVCLLGIKIHGGIGIIIDYDMQLYFRRAKACELAFGDGDFHREILAQELDLKG